MTYPIVYAGPVRDTALPIVYGLADPREPDRIRYVGMTTSPATRYSDHIGGSGGGVRPQWVNDLRRKKLFPLMLLLQKCDSTEVAAGAERDWIKRLRDIGQADFNNAWFVKGRVRYHPELVRISTP